MDLNADRFYEAAARAGLWRTATWMPVDRPPQLAAVGFRAPDGTILDGLARHRGDYCRASLFVCAAAPLGLRVTLSRWGLACREGWPFSPGSV